VQILARLRIIHNEAQRANTALPSRVRPHDQRTPSVSAERHFTRRHVPQEGHKKLQSMHHARRELSIRPKPFLALDDGLQGSAADLTIGSGRREIELATQSGRLTRTQHSLTQHALAQGHQVIATRRKDAKVNFAILRTREVVIDAQVNKRRRHRHMLIRIK